MNHNTKLMLGVAVFLSLLLLVAQDLKTIAPAVDPVETEAIAPQTPLPASPPPSNIMPMDNSAFNTPGPLLPNSSDAPDADAVEVPPPSAVPAPPPAAPTASAVRPKIVIVGGGGSCIDPNPADC